MHRSGCVHMHSECVYENCIPSTELSIWLSISKWRHIGPLIQLVMVERPNIQYILRADHSSVSMSSTLSTEFLHASIIINSSNNHLPILRVIPYNLYTYYSNKQFIELISEWDAYRGLHNQSCMRNHSPQNGLIILATRECIKQLQLLLYQDPQWNSMMVTMISYPMTNYYYKYKNSWKLKK